MSGGVRRVVITGAGSLCALGHGPEAMWDALEWGRSGAVRVAFEGIGELAGFPVDGLEEAAVERFGRRDVRRMDRAGMLAALAGAMALDDAGELGLAPERIGLALGCVHGGVATALEAHRAFLERGADRVGPMSVPLSLTNGAAAAAARMLDLRGPSTVVTTACAAGTDAVGAGLDLIRAGRADVVVAGGAESPLSPVVAAGYLKMGALSASVEDPAVVTRPFDRGRDGFVMGEGAGVVVLEERGRALARGATVLAELAGYAATCDAGHPTDPDPDGGGAARAIALALADAGLGIADIGYVNAHATSTPAGDAAEVRALVRAGLRAAAVSSTKGLHGHALGAAGGLELVALLGVFVRDFLPANVNLDDRDDDGALDLITRVRRTAVGAAMSNSFGFGGHNACLVLRRHEAATG